MCYSPHWCLILECGPYSDTNRDILIYLHIYRHGIQCLVCRCSQCTYPVLVIWQYQFVGEMHRLVFGLEQTQWRWNQLGIPLLCKKNVFIKIPVLLTFDTKINNVYHQCYITWTNVYISYCWLATVIMVLWMSRAKMSQLFILHKNIPSIINFACTVKHYIWKYIHPLLNWLHSLTTELFWSPWQHNSIVATPIAVFGINFTTSCIHVYIPLWSGLLLV